MRDWGPRTMGDCETVAMRCGARPQALDGLCIRLHTLAEREGEFKRSYWTGGEI
jgi:hypothetical protein